MQLPVGHGHLEPLAAGVVIPRLRQVAVLFRIGRISDDGLKQTACGIRQGEELNKGIMSHEITHERGSPRIIGAYGTIRGQAFDDVRGQLSGQTLDTLKFGYKKFRHAASDQRFHFLVGEGCIASFLIGFHNLVVNQPHGRMLLGHFTPR